MGETKLTSVGTLKPGNYVVMGGVACIVKNIQTSRPGKHGHAKCRIEAIGLVDGQKRIEVHPGHDNIQVPIIEKKTAQVLSITNDIVNVMDLETYETFDLKMPEELKEQIKEGSMVVYWIVMDEKILKQVK